MYAVFRVKKFKASDITKIAKELGRTPEDARYSASYASDIDWSRTGENIHLVPATAAKSRINNMIKDAGARVRPDSVVALGVVVSASPEYFTPKPDGNGWEYDDKTAKFFEDGRQLIIDELCGGDPSRIVSLVVHLDETTPHLQAMICPLTENERGETVLSAKRILNGRQRMREIQNHVHEVLGKPRGFERGEMVDLDKAPTKKHTTNQEYKQELKEQAEAMRVAVAKVVDAAEQLQNTPAILDNSKKTLFGRGRVISNDNYNKVVDMLRVVEAVPEATEGLKELADKADKDKRVQAAEARAEAAEARAEVAEQTSQEFSRRLENGLEKARGWSQEVKEKRAIVDVLSTLYVSPERSLLDILEQSKKFSTDGQGIVDYSRIPSMFLTLYRKAQEEKTRIHTREREHEHAHHRSR